MRTPLPSNAEIIAALEYVRASAHAVANLVVQSRDGVGFVYRGDAREIEELRRALAAAEDLARKASRA